MEAVFLQLLGMSYQAGVVVCFILLTRWVFQLCKVPKKYSYFIWAIPYIRFLCPFSLESIFSVFPKKQQLFQQNPIGQVASQNLKNSGLSFIDFSFFKDSVSLDSSKLANGLTS